MTRDDKTLCVAAGMAAASIFFVMVLVALVLALSGSRAHAHDHDRADLTDWFMSLRNKRAVPCCDGHDATKLADVDWQSTPDGKHYQVRVEGKWVDVPDDSVIDAPNREGQAMVWFYNGQLLCFMPGAGT